MPSKGQCRTPLQELRAFWKKVDCSGDECWEWQGATAGIGYGAWFPGGKHVPAHRYSYLKTYGVDPGDKCVCHKCDNPACVRPDHMFLGTHKDNAVDRQAKRRRGWRYKGNRPATPDERRQMLKMHLEGKPTKEIAGHFGRSTRGVRLIVSQER